MGNHECEWIEDRLPLWVDNGDCDGSTEVPGERGDLTAKERQLIEQHLAGCARCQRHRLALEQALGALAVAANHMPIAPDAPSVWPLLEQRIADRDTSGGGRWSTASGRSTARSVRPWANLDSVRPLRRAWTRDTLREMLAGSNQPTSESNRFSTSLIKTSAVAAAVLIALTGTWMAHRQWATAQNMILANSVPLADPLPVTAVAEEPRLEIVDRSRDDVPTNQLEEAEPPRPPETASPKVEATVPKPSMHTRFGFDLEHGIPMPPDSREAKPVY
jgi:Putative zinc-finger